MARRWRSLPVEGSLRELFAFVAIAFVVSYATLAETFLVTVVASIIVVGVAVAVSLSDIRWAWALYFLAICSSGLQTTVSGLTVRPEYFAAPIFVLALYAHSRRDGTSAARRPVPGGVYIGAAGLVATGLLSSLLVAPEAGASLRMGVQLIVALLAMIPLASVNIDIRTTILWSSVILCTISVASILYFLVDPSRRVSGLAFEYNIMGSLCVGWIGVLYYFADDAKVVTRQVFAMSVPIVIALILTSTRAAWVALGFILLFWAARNVTKQPVTVFSSLLAAALAAFYLQEIYYSVGDQDTFLWRVVHVVDIQTGTGAYRVQLWNDALTQIATRDWGVLFGTGLNSFPQFNPVDPTFVAAAYLSSMWLAVLYDVGIVGTIFFLVLATSLFLAVKNKWRAVPLFVALAVCTSITNIIWFAFPWTLIALVVNASLVGTTVPLRKSKRSARGAHRRRHRLVPS
ncbi:O-antigen ligase family protein [Rhodococcoides fascians]|uniref:O-antigen ligase family protein n=1 Tax=Rhodococcoides fascians TaxID=1828 RepID=UPI0009B8469F|nr:O-antigen ligase family protein [Rhodococcus fascians]